MLKKEELRKALGASKSFFYQQNFVKIFIENINLLLLHFAASTKDAEDCPREYH